MPYTGDPAGVPADAVRFRVGDVGLTVKSSILSDAEYSYLLGLSGGAILPAAVDAALSIAAQFARQPRVSHGPSSVDPTKTPDHYHKLADEIGMEINRVADASAGGISIDDKSVQETDTDAVQPVFSMGQDDRHGTSGNLNAIDWTNV